MSLPRHRSQIRRGSSSISVRHRSSGGAISMIGGGGGDVQGQFHYEILTDLLGDGIFTVDGEKWRQQRKLSSYEFSTRMLKEYSSQAFRKIAVTLAHVVSEAANSDQPLEVQDLFMKSTLDSVFKVVLGVDLNSMCGTNEEGTLFTNAFDEASAVTLLRYVDVCWKIKRFLNIGSEKNMKNCVKIVDKFVYKTINSKIEQHRSNLQDGVQDGKVCFADDTLPDGTSVRKGDLVGYQPYVMGRMERLWGDDAKVFRPERWLNQDNIFRQQSPFKFTAFQAGPRICLGKDFAYRQMKIFAAVLLGSFVFTLKDEQKPVHYKTMLTLHVDGGLHLRAYHRFENANSMRA